MHIYVYTGIIGPDGIFYDWYDEPVGRHTDQDFMNMSGKHIIYTYMLIYSACNSCIQAYVYMYIHV